MCVKKAEKITAGDSKHFPDRISYMHSAVSNNPETLHYALRSAYTAANSQKATLLWE